MKLKKEKVIFRAMLELFLELYGKVPLNLINLVGKTSRRTTLAK